MVCGEKEIETLETCHVTIQYWNSSYHLYALGWIPRGTLNIVWFALAFRIGNFDLLWSHIFWAVSNQRIDPGNMMKYRTVTAFLF